uniref:Non-specific serine/threonine protein kinase n=2 Tax=Alexandrium catenella TaxID=2925 RepID=A0A7S1WRZ1_ALECA
MGAATSVQDAAVCCGALQGLRKQANSMLPAPTYLQRGAKCTLGHRTANTNSGLIRLYEVDEDTLGKGSFGVVRKTVSKKTGTACVMKTIAKHGMDQDVLAFLANEIAIQEMCDHPNIARIYESFEDPAEIHIAMECCDGGDAFDYLQAQGGCLSEPDAKIMIHELLQAIFYLHSVQHVAHRDVKPENLLLKYRGAPMRDQVVKLIDFGFAQSFEPGESSLSEVCGTPIYMAPETVRDFYCEKCDVWSCGVALFEFLSGDVPFSCTSPQKLLKMAAVRPINLSGSEWDGVSSLAKALLRRMLAKEPGNRLSAGEALQHEWFREPAAPRVGEAGHPCGSGRIAQNLRDFSSLGDFQKAALRLAAYRLDDDHVQEHRSAFRALDANGDGRLTLEELKDGCPELGLSAGEAEGLFRELDVDGSGAIEYTEFLGAAVCKGALPRHACWEAFRVCDRDGSGTIQACEVEEVVERLCSKERSSSKESFTSTSAGSVSSGGSTYGNGSTDGSGADAQELDFTRFMALLRAP